MSKSLFVLFFLPSLLFAQYTPEEKSEEVELVYSKELQPLTDYKNTFRWNLTPMVLLGSRNVNLGYERVISDKETVSINVGYLEINKLLSKSEQVEYVDGNRDRGGFSIFLDYKRYLNNRNKRSAPEGVYWGAFTGIYNQKFRSNYKTETVTDDGTILTGEADIYTKINSYNLGLELGYQFIFYDRFTVDLILVGPAMSLYTGNLDGTFSGDLNKSDEFQGIIDDLYDKVPWLEDSIDGNELSTSGSISKFAIFGKNFRYVVQIGYRF